MKRYPTVGAKSVGRRQLWIDALCINQIDTAERSQQVQNMHAVYGYSQRTLIYLGEADETTARAIELVKCHSENREYLIEPFPNTPNRGIEEASKLNADELRALFIYFSRSWFSRVWVLQEAALAKSAVCYCGSLEISWRHICRSNESLSLRLFLDKFKTPEYQVIREGLGRGLGLTRLGFSCLEQEQSDKPNSRPGFDLDLERLLLFGRFLGATDPRDHFYAFVGLMRQRGSGRKLPDWLRIDYSKTVDEVMRDATKACFHQFGSLVPFWLMDWNPALLPVNDETSWSIRWDVRRRSSFEMRANFSPRSRRHVYGLDRDIMHQASSPSSVFLKGFAVSAILLVLPETPDVQYDPRLQAAPRAALVTYLHNCIDTLVECKLEQSLSLILKTMAAGDIQDTLDGLRDLETVFETLTMWASLDENLANHREARVVQKLEQWFNQASKYGYKRRLFITAEGCIGLGPHSAQKDDLIALLYGSEQCALLRVDTKNSKTAPSNEWRYRYVGLSYVDRVTVGEAIRERLEAGEEPRIFEII